MIKIPAKAIKRLSVYYRFLTAEFKETAETVSSAQLAELTGIPSDQIRRDLAYFGQFGRRGAGYPINLLSAQIVKILGLDQPKNVAIVGAGNLGKALAAYKGFAKQGFHPVAVFDNNPSKVGRKVSGIDCFFWGRFEPVIKQKKIALAILTVPAEAAQEAAAKLAKAGIKGIMNFAPVNLSLPAAVKVINVDLTLELESLSYFLKESAF